MKCAAGCFSGVQCLLCLCMLQASDNSAAKNVVANDRRSCDDDDNDLQSFSETY